MAVFQGKIGPEQLRVFKQALWNEYGSFADKRIKNLDKGSIFIVDDRMDRDIGADKRLLSYFCIIFAEVVGEREIRVSMQGNIPTNADVDDILKAYRLTIIGHYPRRLEFTITPDNCNLLSELATSIQSIVAPGKSYEERSYKYTCPRVAKSLRRLQQTLETTWAK